MPLLLFVVQLFGNLNVENTFIFTLTLEELPTNRRTTTLNIFHVASIPFMQLTFILFIVVFGEQLICTHVICSHFSHTLYNIVFPSGYVYNVHSVHSGFDKRQ